MVINKKTLTERANAPKHYLTGQKKQNPLAIKNNLITESQHCFFCASSNNKSVLQEPVDYITFPL
jgi:hypothetical protein